MTKSNLSVMPFVIETLTIIQIPIRQDPIETESKDSATIIIEEAKQRIEIVHSNLDTGDARFRGSCADADTGERCGVVRCGEREESVPVTQFATRAPLAGRDVTRGNLAMY